ncbi:carbon-nitrogen hydrolase family protein [Pseudomonas sp. NW5]|uniref:carbon-nitrogen hydrolase family protein n=1 Tax=Pseudomonas sp. NW5 TaxID=2934934 RepID=UPI002021986D|nr:carbon-nitrogen hydrolase family protein [Pseudomonas sp. NW5]MCL7461470.1 carbon-nitrogen hydrolase family protein [Pseudomonas sp. NW5]
MSTFAVIQMISQPSVEANLQRARILLEEAAAGGAQLAVLPENFATLGCGDQAALARAEAAGEGPLLSWLARTGRELGVWLLAGSLPLFGEGAACGRPHASSLLLDADGQCVARYDKLHLFDAQVADGRGLYRESDDFAAGQRIVVADTPVGRLGLSICYDLRFAELYSALRLAGAELICVPSAFTALTGAAHWEVLVRARAIETQCYLLAANQGGVHPGGRETFGHSLIVDPWGAVLANAAQGERVVLAQRDASAQQALRARMPVFEHRRLYPGPLQASSQESP